MDYMYGSLPPYVFQITGFRVNQSAPTGHPACGEVRRQYPRAVLFPEKGGVFKTGAGFYAEDGAPARGAPIWPGSGLLKISALPASRR
jgi:hypothetical protein